MTDVLMFWAGAVTLEAANSVLLNHDAQIISTLSQIPLSNNKE
jgi:hypothetical protein